MLLLKFFAPLLRRLITMDQSLYTAAMEGKLDYLNQHTDQFALQATPNNNTVLHVVAEFGHSPCVADILTNCPSLLCRTNTDGDTPLHIAAAGGHDDVVESLIAFTKSLADNNGGVTEMLRARNRDGDTPLHLAARLMEPLGIVSLLTRADEWLDYGPNEAGETPLYLVVERGSGVEVVAEILKNCKSPAYGGPGGRTAMHAAVSFYSDDTQSLSKLLEAKEDLIKEADAYGWTPLHLAARVENDKAVGMFLENDKSVAYVAANNDVGKTALHIAVAVGNVGIMDQLLSACPDCWEMVNSKGQNILHISADLEMDSATTYILEMPWGSRLINRKDNEGNTPLYVIASNSKRPIWFDNYRGADTRLFNNDNLIPFELRFLKNVRREAWPRALIWHDSERDTVRKDEESIISWKKKQEERQEEEEKKKKEAAEEVSEMAKTHIIVATLISTISFAAGFTIPGGYDGNQGPNQGMAVLVRDAAFKAFVISNTIAVICSTSSVFLYVSAVVFNSKYDGDKRSHRYRTAFWLIIIAMAAMTLAFITGTYTVLTHSSGLGIVTGVIGCSSFIVYIFELGRHYYWTAPWTDYMDRLIFRFLDCIRSTANS